MKYIRPGGWSAFAQELKHLISSVLSKTSGSFERAVKRFETNRRLLNALPIAE
jgi:hypothetical protein